MWILTRTHDVLGIQVTLYFTLNQDQELTTDINQAFKLSSRKEAERLNHLLLRDISFDVTEFPKTYRTRGIVEP
jgi:hypothetical protein